MIPLPASLRIIGQTYAVSFMDEFTADAADALGLIDHTKLRIQIRAGMPTEKTLECLIHEAAHGITYAMHSDETEDDAEAIVDRFGRGFMALLRDNPELLQYITESLK